MSLTLYLLVFCFTAWAMQVALFNSYRTARLITAGLWLPFLFISLVYRFISGYNYNYADAHTALSNTSLLSSAIQNYALPVLGALATTMGVAAVLRLVTKRFRYTYQASYALALLPAVLLGYWYINRTLGVIDDLPALYRVPLSTLTAYNHALPQTQREPVKVVPKHPGAKHLFLIVDESITGSALSLNGQEANTTPFLKSVAPELQNFGIASACTNYSAGSNIALMSGLQSHELPDKDRKALQQPSIFQYAKKAGYTTYFVDMQMGRGILQNFMTLHDLESVDHYLYVTEEQLEQPYYERDFFIADLLLKLSKSDEKVFVYANKVGAHWPYARTYPPDSTFYRPVLSERSILKSRKKSTNTYFNSLRWSVDRFWEKLMGGITPQDSTFIIYTSDHGQDLSGDGISITHASVSNVSPVEANVPLWCLDKSGYTAMLTKPKPNQQTHAQIFPTLLMLQGYAPSHIRSRYGPTLYESPPANRVFLSGDIFGRGANSIIPFRY
ncbi:sulfatase-like hydrolase/transferase [Pontibacter sp. JH31]|uniref:Sulfatase-like hydrolase/transferase n=1 Tax=Pontibacter aquaedesilientis TaxID=2766980 RepID=A0ABR7XJ09_9BACT|nr:sulfatase-like hydrolase/transferase [Pontibacter aquaedesilientis]MBD1398259.1 sulfatase-like hydrolase/transferase [Pontibacter aquaedesilientis]